MQTRPLKPLLPRKSHRSFLHAVALLSVTAISQAATAPTPVTQDTMNAPGPEGQLLAAQTGSWVVTETVWATPDAPPVVANNLIAERRVVGNLLEETLLSPTDKTVLRRDFLTFNRLEGRWQYMSFDTRAAVGMMTAQSYGAEGSGVLSLIFQPFALPGSEGAMGQMLRMRQDIVRDGPDHLVKKQYFTLSNGTGGEWLAHQYDSVRMTSR